MSNKKSDYLILGIIISIICILGIYYLHFKSGYYVDEGMTLFLANGKYTGSVTTETGYGFGDFIEEFVWRGTVGNTIKNICGMLKEVLQAGNYSEEGTVEWYDAARNLLQGKVTWVSGEELFKQITATKEERFQYLQVYINQVVDVHPPLYYFIVHTVFSVLCNSYSDQYLFGINIFFLTVTCILIFVLLKKLAHDRACAFLTVILYGFSQGFFSCALYFRMYAMETFWIVLTLYIYLNIKESEWQFRKKDYIFLFLTALLGFGTHYYYILYLMPLFVITCIRLFKEKKRKQLKQYMKAMTLAGAVSLIVWPFSVYHILFGYRGTEAIANLNVNGISSRLFALGRVLIHAIFLDSFCLTIFLIVIGVSCIALNCKFCAPILRWLKDNSIEICIPMIVYGCVVAKVAPVMADRYIMGVLPVFFMLVACLIVNFIKTIIWLCKFNRNISGICEKIVISGIGIAYAAATFMLTTPEYLYLEQKDLRLDIPFEREEMNCLMVADDDYRGFPETLKLSEFAQVMVIEEKNLRLLETEKPKNSDHIMIVYILDCLEKEEIIGDIMEMLGEGDKEVKAVSSDIEGFSAYLF